MLPYMKEEMIKIFSREKESREELWKHGIVKSSQMPPHKHPEYMGIEEVWIVLISNLINLVLLYLVFETLKLMEYSYFSWNFILQTYRIQSALFAFSICTSQLWSAVVDHLLLFVLRYGKISMNLPPFYPWIASGPIVYIDHVLCFCKL